MTLVLPSPAFPDDAWPEHVAERWQAAAERAEEVARRAGTGHRYPALRAEAERLLDARDTEALTGRLQDRLFARAVVELWATDERLAQRAMTPQLLGAVAPPGHPVSRLATISMISALLGYFDRVDDWEEGRLEAVGAAVERAVRGCRVREERDVVEVVRDAGRYLASKDGPGLLARDVIATGLRLDDHPVAVALCGNDQGRFAQLVRNSYFLSLVARADHTVSGHEFLDDATARATRLRRDDNDRRFGIAVLAALCDKPDGVVPSEQWVDAVLAVGGDPRHEQSTAWHDWWSHIAPHLRSRAARWMTGADLRAFLDAVKTYGEQTGNDSLQRMFTRRHRFLMGLYESGRVKSVRLILGSDIRTTVRRVTKVSLFDAAEFKDQAKDTAVVMVDCGDFHLVEGSHNFRLHVYLGPPDDELSDPHRREFSRDELIHTFPARHAARHPAGATAYGAWTHDVGGSWVRSALDFLRERGVRVDESNLLTDADVAALVRRRRPATRTLSRFSWRRR